MNSQTQPESYLPTLYLYINNENKSLIDWYKMQTIKHNDDIITNPFPNAGFDLTVPNDTDIISIKSTLVDLQIKGKMVENDRAIGYYMYPRSSLSKTPLVLANHTGIIDCGYRGNLMGAFRNLDKEPYMIKQFERLLQICHPSLKPFRIEIVESEQELGDTIRGTGGFGSTGK
jgi:dUTP pyrophosphatase